MLKLAFEELNLNKIYALALDTNIGSWRVMEKLAMEYEGKRRQDLIKDGVFVDLKAYSILKEDWIKSQPNK